MKNKKKGHRRAPKTGYKGNDYLLDNPIRLKILNLFLQGGKYTVTDLSKLLDIPDPRSHIRYIREAGYPVSDYWEHSKYSKYKVYFIHIEKRSNG